jgi:hypothetical protein
LPAPNPLPGNGNPGRWLALLDTIPAKSGKTPTVRKMRILWTVDIAVVLI